MMQIAYAIDLRRSLSFNRSNVDGADNEYMASCKCFDNVREI